MLPMIDAWQVILLFKPFEEKTQPFAETGLKPVLSICLRLDLGSD